jgi:hypothetical protein
VSLDQLEWAGLFNPLSTAEGIMRSKPFFYLIKIGKVHDIEDERSNADGLLPRMRRRAGVAQVQGERAGIVEAENHHPVRPKDLVEIRHVLVEGE